MISNLKHSQLWHPAPNTQADIVATGRCKYLITDFDLNMKKQGNDTESPSDDPILPEVHIATAPGTKMAPFPLINVGSDFHCLRSFFFFFPFYTASMIQGLGWTRLASLTGGDV